MAPVSAISSSFCQCAWSRGLLADLYRYFRNSHAAESITTGVQRQRQARQTRWAYDGFRYKVAVLQYENAKEEKQSDWNYEAKQIRFTIPRRSCTERTGS
jgi:hypothetical protein